MFFAILQWSELQNYVSTIKMMEPLVGYGDHWSDGVSMFHSMIW